MKRSKQMNEDITLDPRICNGKPVVRETRIPVTVILDQLADTDSIEGVLQKYPELTSQQIVAVLHYRHSVNVECTSDKGMTSPL